MDAVYIAYISINEIYDEDDIYEEREKYESMIKLILKKADHDLLDLKEIMNKACRYDCLDVVTFLLENTDHEKLDIMKAVNIAYSSISDEDDDDGDIYEKREKKEQLFKLILEKADHDLLDMKEIMNKACCYGYLDVVTCLLENTDHEKLYIMGAVKEAYSQLCYDYSNEQSKTKESLVKLILEKVDHDLLDLKEIMNDAFLLVFKTLSRFCWKIPIMKNVVTFLLENTDHEKLDLMEAVKSAYDSSWYEGDIDELMVKKEHLIKLILEKVDHDLLDLKEIMVKACHYHYLDFVTFLLENTDHEKFNIMEAVNSAYNSIWYESDINELIVKNEHLIKRILEKVDHNLLDLKEIMNKACCYGYQDVVTFLLENTDHGKLDIMKAVNTAYSSISDEDCDEGDIYEAREKKEPLFKLILEKVDHDLLDLKEIMNKAWRYGHQDVVTFLLENVDHDKLDIMKVVNTAYSSISDEDCDEGDIYEAREKKEPLFKLILEKVDHDLLDLKEIMNKACCYGYQDVVTFLLENVDHDKLDIMNAINKACNPSINEDDWNIYIYRSIYEKLVKLVLHKVKTDLLDMEILMNVACRNCWLNIVRWLVENIDHAMFDVDNAINVFILHDSDETLDIFKLFLQNISLNSFNIGTVIEQASRLNHTDKVLWLLQNKDNSFLTLNM
ncbi:unnamed protein product [Mytilus edulis]|uniref:Ankyrin repeat protein n=1 Tax=Mytilus edulis TaxID=6550 RepID=A0A8S3U9J4_MYTED|nr:unnamed protein product [Mytilus edulis]